MITLIIVQFIGFLEKMVDLKAIMLGLLYCIGFLFHGVFLQIDTIDATWSDLILGPLGALVLSVVALYFLWNYMRKKDDIIKAIREQQLNDKDNEIKALKEELKELKSKLNLN